MTDITPEKHAEAEDHFIQLINALYELMVDAYGDEMANLLFSNLNSSEDCDDCCISSCKKEKIRDQAQADYLYMKKAMEILDSVYGFDK